MKNHDLPHMKAGLACLMVMTAVATVFMTQAIFLEIATSFHIDISRARFAFSVASLCYSAAFFFIGPMADRFNQPHMAVSGLFALSVALLCAASAPGFLFFITAMGIAGFSAALIPAAMFPYMNVIAPCEKRGLCVGAVVASGTLGIVLGRVAIGVISAKAGWPFAFQATSALLILLAVTGVYVLGGDNQRGNPSTGTIPELYLRSLKLLITPRPLVLLVTGFLLFFGFLGMVTFLTYRLVTPPFSFTSGDVGWISLAGITALIAPFAGNLSQKTGPFKIGIPGLVVCIIATQLMGWASSVPAVTLGLLLLFAGAYCCQPLIFLLMGQSVPNEALGSASSLYILVCIGGGSLSSMILGPIWASLGWTGITLACTVSLALATAALGSLAMYERKTLVSP